MTLTAASEQLAQEWAGQQRTIVGPREFLLAHWALQQLADHQSDHGGLLEDICRQRWTAEFDAGSAA